MPLVLATAHLGDGGFLEAFDSCRLKTSEFRHADYLRLAWLHLHQEPLDDALTRVRARIHAFATHHGLFHRFWTPKFLGSLEARMRWVPPDRSDWPLPHGMTP